MELRHMESAGGGQKGSRREQKGPPRGSGRKQKTLTIWCYGSGGVAPGSKPELTKLKKTRIDPPSGMYGSGRSG
eukprot:333315-Prorocentrum_minimum.AAC.1